MTALRVLLLAAACVIPAPALALAPALPLSASVTVEPEPSAPSATSADREPSSSTLSGLVTEDTVLSGGTLEIASDVTVAPGVRLVLDNLDIIFHATKAMHPVLRVLPGGTLEISESRLANHQGLAGGDRAAAYYVVDALGRLHLRDSEVRFAKSIDLSGPGATGSVVERTLFDEMTWSGVVATRGASITVVDNVFTDIHFAEIEPLTGGDPLDPQTGILGGGVVLVDTPAVLVARNLFERVDGTAAIVAQATGIGSFARETSGLIHANVILTDHVAFYADGGTPALHFENNAVRAGQVGAYTAYGSGAEISRNEFHGFPVRDAATGVTFPALAGVWASGSDTVKAYDHEISILGNRFRGFEAGVVQSDGANPFARGNDLAGNAAGARAFGEGNGEFDPAEAILDARANWWGDAMGPRDDDADDGSAPASNDGAGAPAEGRLDYSEWLGEAPVTASDVSIELSRLGPRRFVATISNAGEHVVHPDLTLHGLPPGTAARMRVPETLGPGETIEVEIRTSRNVPRDLVAALRTEVGASLASA